MKKPKPIPEYDRPGRRCYSRQVSKDIGLQIYDSSYATANDSVVLEITLHHGIVRKHRDVIDAVFAWAKALP
jgi:hypothetical protein